MEGGGKGIRHMVAGERKMRKSCGEQVENREYEMKIDEEIDRKRR